MWLDVERIVHSIKTGLGCLIGFGIVTALHSYLLFDQWLIVTILVVMCAQLSVGSVFYKAILRFIGTVVGSLLAIFAIIYFGNDTLAYAGTIAIAGMFFSYIATGKNGYSDVGTLGAVTTAIILINPNPTVALGFERFFEISIGILIATLISQFVLPIHARTHLRRTQAQTMNLLSDYYRLATADTEASNDSILVLDEKIVQSIQTQRKLANDAKRELLGSKFEPQQFKRLLEGEKGLLRSVDFLNRLYSETNARQLLHGNQAWHNLNNKIQGTLSKMAAQIVHPQAPAIHIEVPSLSDFKKDLTESSARNPDELKQLEVFFFCLENILSRLQELAAAIS